VSSPHTQPRVWIEIDLSAIRANYEQVVAFKAPEARCLAVVKADGYGLGGEALAKALAQAGCDAFGVTTVAQGAALRRGGIQGLILVMGPTKPDEWSEALATELTLAVSELTMLQELEEFCAAQHGEEPALSRTLDIHLEIETGLGRTGLFPEDLRAAMPVLLSLRCLKITGIYTHFAQAERKRGRKYSQRQFRQFCSAVDFLKENGIEPGLRHVCNSPAFLTFPEFHLDMVRIGTLLIGQLPASHLGGRLKLRDPWTAKAKILQVRRVPAGKRVGYNGLYRTRTDTQLAVIGLGYADGFAVEPRLVPKGVFDLAKIIIKNIFLLCNIPWHSGSDNIFIGGHRVRVAGKVGMELTVLDVGQIDCTTDQDAMIPLRRTSAGSRLQRVYFDGEECLFPPCVEDAADKFVE